MSALPVLEVAIGLSFAYLLLALINTTITEWIARLSDARGKMLKRAIQQMLGEDNGSAAGLTEAVYDHALIKPLAQPTKPLLRAKAAPRRRLPSYIASDVFARALSDVVRSRQASPLVPGEAGRRLLTLPAPLAALKRNESDALPNPPDIEQWYKQFMERVSGWYKRRTQTVVLVIAVAMTLLLNANSVGLAERLWSDSTLREAVVESAKVRLQQGPPLQVVEYEDPTTPKPANPSPAGGSANVLLPDEQKLLAGLMGWSQEPNPGSWFAAGMESWWLSHLAGWLITALAVSLGAPFWFDTLNRFMNIRSGGRNPDTERSKT